MNTLVNLWNRFVEPRFSARGSLLLGFQVVDERITRKPIYLTDLARSQHIVILGKTGTGKTSLMKSMLEQDIARGRGFLCIDLHGELTPFVLGKIAEREQKKQVDLSSRTLVISGDDENRSVGLNILEAAGRTLPVLISEIVSVVRQRWNLDHLGARTEELLRNALWVLAESGLALTDLASLLTDSNFRTSLLWKCHNPEVTEYFNERYDRLSDAMQGVFREAILNKVSAFTLDPAVRHIVGQRKSTFHLLEALDQGFWVVLSVSKSRLGENASTLAALILTCFKNTIFIRKSRILFSIYADELQALVSSSETFEILLAEARKFGVSLVTANQYMSQHSAQTRSGLLSAGTILSFRSSSEDAVRIASAIGGGERTMQRLKQLPDRHALSQTGASQTLELIAPVVSSSRVSFASLLARSNGKWARLRTEVDEQISSRRISKDGRRELLEKWK